MDWAHGMRSMLRYAIAMLGRAMASGALRLALKPREIELWKRVTTDCGRIAALLTFDEQDATAITVSTERRT